MISTLFGNFMFKRILKFLKNPVLGILTFFIYIFGLPFFYLNYFSITEIYFFDFIIITSIILIFSEIIFRISYKSYHGVEFRFVKKIPFSKLYVEPHPYLPYIYKKNFDTAPSEKYNYPLHKNFYSAKLKTNNYGFYNGVNGDRNIQIPKPYFSPSGSSLPS